MGTSDREPQALSVDEKRDKIKSNYETIEILKARLEESNRKEKASMTRAAYVRMILDATKKVDSQNEELSKAILDVRHLQRDISNLCGRLERSFTLVERNILKDAINDGWSRECYRLLNTMHNNCDQLIQAVQETGELTREIRQLEDQIGQTLMVKAVEKV